MEDVLYSDCRHRSIRRNNIQKEKQRLIKEGKIRKEKSLPEIAEDDILLDIPENWRWVRVEGIGIFVHGLRIQKTIQSLKECNVFVMERFIHPITIHL